MKDLILGIIIGVLFMLAIPTMVELGWIPASIAGNGQYN